MNTMVKYFLLLIITLGAGILHAQKNFEIRYLGNMGIAVSHNDSTILIDALHDFYESDYLQTDEQALKAILAKQAPYKKIIAIAVTHRHSDHFDSAVVTRVMNVHGSTLLVSGGQTMSLLSSDLQKKFTKVTDSLTIRINDRLKLHLYRIPHTYAARHAAVENYRVEITWNNFRLVHLGDADEKDEAIDLLKEKPGVMVVPSWYLSDKGTELLNKVKPGKILVTHISPADNALYKNEKLKSEVISFRKYGDILKL